MGVDCRSKAFKNGNFKHVWKQILVVPVIILNWSDTMYCKILSNWKYFIGK